MTGEQQAADHVDKIVTDATNAVKKEMYKRFGIAIVSGAIGMFVLAALGAWTILLPTSIEHIGGVPKEAVVAFNIDDGLSCPPGWSHFESARARVLVGAGDPREAPGKMGFDRHGERLTQYVRGQHGGAEKHILSEAEMPSHGHDNGTLTAGASELFIHRSDGRYAAPSGALHDNLYGPSHGVNFGSHEHPITGSTDFSGMGKPHNNMPPYIALYFCKKN